MSFECKDCHARLDCTYHTGDSFTPGSFTASFGPCESCGKVSACVNCRAPAKIINRQAPAKTRKSPRVIVVDAPRPITHCPSCEKSLGFAGILASNPPLCGACRMPLRKKGSP